jgi:hypothetical protein
MISHPGGSARLLSRCIRYVLRRRLAFIVLLLSILAARISVEYLPGAGMKKEERYEEEARKLRPVDTSSPVSPFAKSLAGRDWTVVQCDGTPSVRAGGHKGYRILLRRVTRAIREIDGSAMPRLQRHHRDFIFFPVGEKGADRLSRLIKWERLEQRPPDWGRILGPPVPVHMGRGHGFEWYGNLTIPDQDAIRTELQLQGGDDRFELAKRHLEATEGKEARKHALSLLTRQGEAAIPLLLDEIERDRYGCGGHALRELSTIPGEKTTTLLVSFHDGQRHRIRAAQLIAGRPPTAWAKDVYLDILRAYPTDPYRGSFGNAVRALVHLQCKEAIPLLKEASGCPYVFWYYADCRRAIRELEGTTSGCDLSEPVKTLRALAYDWIEPPPPEEELDAAKQEILDCEDTEEAILAALELATFVGKCNPGQSHQIGVTLLTQLPRHRVQPVLEHLAGTVRDPLARERVVEILTQVRDGLPTEASVAPNSPD